MKITVNKDTVLDVKQDSPTIMTVLTLAQLNVTSADNAMMAIAVNNDIVPKQAWNEHVLNDGDNLNIFGAIAGG